MANQPEPARSEPTRQAELRASDADREQVAAVLREAAAEGRIGMDELDERLDAVYTAKTYAELAPITRDLPLTGAAISPVTPSATTAQITNRVGGTPTSSGAFAVMGGFNRKGAWVAPKRFRCFAFMGGGEIDLRDARFEDREIRINAFTMMGGIEVIVPEDVEVHVNGVGFMGGFEHMSHVPPNPGAPRVIISGFAFMGGVGVKRRPTSEEMRRRKLERKQRKLDDQRRGIEG